MLLGRESSISGDEGSIGGRVHLLGVSSKWCRGRVRLARRFCLECACRPQSSPCCSLCTHTQCAHWQVHMHLVASQLAALAALPSLHAHARVHIHTCTNGASSTRVLMRMQPQQVQILPKPMQAIPAGVFSAWRSRPQQSSREKEGQALSLNVSISGHVLRLGIRIFFKSKWCASP